MQIEKNLPQFAGEKVLLIVAGETTARFFIAGDGIIEEAEPLQIPRVHYSDKEGFFIKGAGVQKTSGSVREEDRRSAQAEFLQDLVVEVQRLHTHDHFHSLYLFSPDYMSKETKEVLPADLRSLIKMEFPGNLAWKHPFDFLRAIKSRQEGRSRMLKIALPEARKLLDKPIVI